MNKKMYDVVYYWVGGTEAGKWCEAAGSDLEALITSIERQGRVAHLGSRGIGAPEGAPSVADLRRVGFLS